VSDEHLALWGTLEVPAEPRLLTAGPLQALLERGGLRAVRWHGREALRAIAFLVRVEGWRTAEPELADLSVEEEPGRFLVRYRATVREAGAELLYEVVLEGQAQGLLRARATLLPRTDFLTQRTGFVVLHPLAGVAGAPVSVEHVDGRREESVLPAAIAPSQPLRDIRAIVHHPAPGVTATTLLEGDTFEMEDQRNWSDASFKTYSRPLALPHPYLLAAGSSLEQAVTLRLAGVPAAGARAGAGSQDAIAIRVGGETTTVAPRVGLAVPAELAAASLAVADVLREAAPRTLLAHLDLTRGHGREELVAVRRLADAVAAAVTLEIVVPDEEDPGAALARAAAEVAAAQLSPAAVSVFAKSDQISFQPGEPRPPGPTLEALYSAARRAFPGRPLGGGSPAFFPELNRRPPPSALLDFVTYGTCPIVHAADDRSVMETLEALPWIVRSAQAIAGKAALHVGPVAIGARLNPYGKAPSPNPDNRRVPLAEVDPRQRGLFGAAWYLGYAAAVAPLGVAELVLAAPVGPFGIAHVPQPHAQPWFDGRRRPAVFPVFHVVAELAAASGRKLLATEVADPSRAAALAWSEGGRTHVLLANLTAAPTSVRLDGLAGRAEVRVLELGTFERACLDWRGFRRDRRPFDPRGPLELPVHAVASIEAVAAGPEDQPAGAEVVVVMGVSGSGKSTVASLLAGRLGCDLADADDFHPPSNVSKMAAGLPLDDQDRAPWLRDIAAWLSARARSGRSAVVSCSALKRAYRDVLRAACPRLVFLHLDGPREILMRRMRKRTGHFMPASLLDSQLAALEPLEPDERGLRLDVTAAPEVIVAAALAGWAPASAHGGKAKEGWSP